MHTAPAHYSSILMQAYLPGDPIEISTVDDDKLENSRQFEVILTDPSLNPLNVLNPNRVIVTIRDNDGMLLTLALSLSLSLSLSLFLSSYLKLVLSLTHAHTES